MELYVWQIAILTIVSVVVGIGITYLIKDKE